MRPLRLEMEGFGAFREATTVDFADLDLVAFVGPTGSGKSTVIDGLTFALYGSVARYDNPSLVAPVIHQLATEARVRFDFELAGRSYTAVRVVRRMKSKPGAAPRASTKEARLEVAEPGGGTTVLAGTVSELDDEVTRLIGLDFSQFTRTIVLPQGDFAEFLRDDPGNRQKLLRRLLDVDIYARMGSLARERASQAAQQLTVYEERLGHLDGVTPRRLAEAEQQGADLRAFQESARRRLEEMAAVDTQLVELREAVNTLDRGLEALATIELPDDLGAGDQAMTEAREAVGEARATLDAARARRDSARSTLDEVGDPAELESKLLRRERADDLASTVRALESQLSAAIEEHETTQVARREHRAAEEAAREALRDIRAGADAAPWLARLRAGEPCPICRQDVATVPDHVSHDQLDAADARHDAARIALSEADTAAAKIAGRIQSLEADLAQQTKAAADLAAELEKVPPAPELQAALARSREAGAAVAEADAACRAAEAALTAAGERLDDLQAAEAGLRRRYTAQRDAVGAAALEPPPPDNVSLAADWQALVGWASHQTEVRRRRREEIVTTGKELAQQKQTVITALTEEGAPLGIEAEPAELATAVAGAIATADAAAERLREQLADKQELLDTVAGLRDHIAVHESLGRQHLSANGFERWLLAEALDDIVVRATDRLFELSNGRYSLEAVDGSFHVRDHGNADERRDVRTLSGGEIFLASLALALALAESIAELAPVDSPRLESIFLDEGFGTLDAETLDVLAAAIEELSASGRLVAIVTHVRDLGERMPVRFEVRKGPSSSMIERVES